MQKDKNNYVERVFAVTRLIPYGRVTYYGAIADYLELGSARMVGWALNKCNWQQDNPVPAHRVVNSQGVLTGSGYFSTPTMMQELLESEDITVKNGKVKNFKALLWIPAEELEGVDNLNF